MNTTTNIVPPRVPFLDERTGLISREWYRFFQYLFVISGNGTFDIGTDRQAPPIQQALDVTSFGFPNKVVGTMGAQNSDRVAISGGSSSGVAITGGSINNTPIGATTPNTGAFTSGAFTSIANTGLTNLSAATAGQIEFPATQNPSSNPHTIDDYAEGSWTPVIVGSVTAGSNTYLIQDGTYLKIGGLVICTWNCAMTAKDAAMAGTISIGGLPFSNAGSISAAAIGVWLNMNANFVSINGFINQLATSVQLWGAKAATSSQAQVLTADIAATTDIVGMVAYKAN